MVFAVMFLTGVLAGAAVLLTAVLVGRLGLCDPFVLPFGKWHWAVNPWRMFQRNVTLTNGLGTSEIVFVQSPALASDPTQIVQSPAPITNLFGTFWTFIESGSLSQAERLNFPPVTGAATLTEFPAGTLTLGSVQIRATHA